MQRKKQILAWCLLMAVWLLPMSAEVFKLENGNLYEGEVAALDEEGLVVRLKIGGFSERIDLVYLSQDTLKRLTETPKYTEFVEPFIELDEKEYHPPEIVVRQPERMARPEGRTSFFATLGSPMGSFVLLVILLSNLFVAYEVAIYRSRPIALVCGISFVLPVIGPIFFLSMPSLQVYGHHEEDVEEEEGPVAVSAPAPVGGGSGPRSKLGISHRAATTGGGNTLDGSSFTKDDTTFNRNFFETTLTEFFRVVPSAPIKGLVVKIKTVKHEYVIKRITRISGTDLHAMLQQGSKEVSIRFGEITQIQVRSKDA